MDKSVIDHLCELSKLNYSDEEKATVTEEMGDIINLMDTIKSFDITYDDTKDHNEIKFDELREDISAPSFETDKLLSNTEPRDDCYVVPKMME